MANIQTIKELWTDGITNGVGVSRRVKMHALIQFDDGTEKWYYFGTPVPVTRPGAIQQPEFLFPADFLNLPQATDLLYSLSVEAMYAKIKNP